MVARVNGEERSRGELADMHFSWDAIVAQAARNTRCCPGDVLGSGTVGTGCILEHGDGRWLQPGDVVELEVEGIGVLRNTVVWLTSRSSGGDERARDRVGARARGVDVVVYEQFELGHTRGSSHGRTRIFRLAYPEAAVGAARAGGARRLARARGGERRGAARPQRAARARREPASELAGGARGVRRAYELLDRDEASAVRRRPRRARRALPARRGRSSTPTARCSAFRAAACASRDEDARSSRSTSSTRTSSSSPPGRGRGAARPPGSTAGGRDARDRRLLPARGPASPSVVAEVVTRGHGFYSLHDPVYGLKVGSHMRGTPADPDAGRGPTRRSSQEIVDWTRERFPTPTRARSHAETCFYTTTDDERFVLERHGRVVVGSACSGHGFKFAPAVGRAARRARARSPRLTILRACRCTSASATSRASGTSSSATTGRS